jgi:hypothetical protein
MREEMSELVGGLSAQAFADSNKIGGITNIDASSRFFPVEDGFLQIMLTA